MDLQSLRHFYRTELFEKVLPFWLQYGIDENGGINSCIRDDGRLVSRDRWCRSQWRAVYVFSKLYNQVEASEKWRDIARGIYRFMTAHGPLPDGTWPLLFDGDGKILRGHESVFADGFAISGLTEFWRATKDPAALDLARQTFNSVESLLNGSEPPPTWPFPTASGWTSHAVSMIFSLVYHELAEVTGDEQVRRASLKHHERVMNMFLRPDRGVVLEWLRNDGSELEPSKGSAVVPGHAIESMWFQMHIARQTGDGQTMKRCVEAIHRHLDIGWDRQFGGLFLAVDAEGRDEVGWDHADTKIWWPQVEALYATLLAYEQCGEDWCLQWHERVREFCWNHYPVEKYGEWRQEMDRQGRPLQNVVGLPVKDPYHLPRALILCLEVLDRLTE